MTDPGAGPDVPVPAVNTHLHLPPNFSAFDSVEQAAALAASEQVRVIGSSNYHHLGVYRRLADAAAREGVAVIFGIEIIAVIDELRQAGVRINDPHNPGRAYLCGKAISRYEQPTAEASRLMARMRAASDERMEHIIDLVEQSFAAAGIGTGLDAPRIAAAVAQRSGVPIEWVALQERHVARAFQEALFAAVEPTALAAMLERLTDQPAAAAWRDQVAAQELLRAGLMKAGRPAFVPEAAVTFEQAYRLVLELGGVPCYPVLADGTDPVCPFEDPAEALAATLVERGVHAAELIPARNRAAVVDRYVRALRDAGIVVLAGTEHNTARMIPVTPTCRDGEPPSEMAREAFWEGACVMAAHQQLVAAGRPGYVRADGRLGSEFADDVARIDWFRSHGARVIADATATGLAV